MSRENPFAAALRHGVELVLKLIIRLPAQGDGLVVIV